VFYIHFDQIGTPRLLIDASNKVRWRWDQADPFGLQPPSESPQNDFIALPFNLRFPGQYYDRETGLHHNGHRDYDPVTGRYVESDPIGLAGGVNTYSYAGADPILHVDPAGLCAVFTPLCYYLVTYGAEIAVGAEIIATVATNTPSPASTSVAFTGRAAQQLTHDVYLGMRSTKPVYVGITSDIANRACQHGDRFDAMVKLTNGALVTKDQARAIEQTILQLNPHFENEINSIASNRTWYQEAVEWGKQWLKNYGM
jgi:RHS repeat-associated protein